MKLTRPTDFEILGAFDKHGRNVAANIAIHLGRDRPYINTRIPHLHDHELLAHVGPAERSGLYEITDRGRVVLTYRDEYEDAGSDGFDELVDDVLDE